MRMVWHCYVGKGVAEGRSRLRLMISLRNTALLRSSQTHTGAFQGRHILRGTFSSSCVAMNVSNTCMSAQTYNCALAFEGHAPSGCRGGSRQAGAQSDVRKVGRCDNRRGSSYVLGYRLKLSLVHSHTCATVSLLCLPSAVFVSGL